MIIKMKNGKQQNNYKHNNNNNNISNITIKTNNILNISINIGKITIKIHIMIRTKSENKCKKQQ